MFAQILTVLAAIGSGLMAGLFFTYSNSILPSLARLPTAQGVGAMNTMNVVIVNPLFLTIFMGTALLSLALIAAALLGWTPRPVWVALGAVIYLAGCIAITMGINVPMNDALGRVAADSAEAARLWAVYLDRWVFWNHIRAAACVAAMAAFIASLMA